ncbi:MAG: hypothetical protein MJZ25_02240 [Fibrobacter sp.]|nr:hypothetical protein [Fibrobacter sp.]
MATELEILTRAEMYLRKMSLGINPLNDQDVTDSDICKQERICKCLTYVADLLQKQVKRLDYRQKKYSAKPLDASLIDLNSLPVVEGNITLKAVASNINRIIPDGHTTLKWRDINSLLHITGVLSRQLDERDHKIDVLTDYGKSIGFEQNYLTWKNKTNLFTLCPINAQKFIFEHLGELADIANRRQNRVKSIREKYVKNKLI